MTSAADEPLRPVEETLVHKTDVLDWDQVTSSSCCLEFRDDVSLGLNDSIGLIFQLLIQVALISTVAWIGSWLAGQWLAPLLVRADVAALTVAAGVAWALFHEVQRQTSTDGGPLPLTDLGTWVRAFLPPLVWQSLTFTAKLDQVVGGYLFYTMATLPAAILFFDHFATHAVYWLTAGRRAGHAAKMAGRDVWDDRKHPFKADEKSRSAATESVASPAFAEVIRATAGYRWGGVWALLALLVPALFVVITNPDRATSTVGLQLAVGGCFGLLFGATLASGGDIRFVPRFFVMLIHWLYYGWEDRLPPWAFHSTCGDWPKRQLAATLIVALVAIPLVSLAAHSFAELSVCAQARAAADPISNPLPEGDGNWRSLTTSSATFAVLSWLWVAPTIVTAFSLPAIHFFLIGILLTGRIISVYYDAYELPQQTGFDQPRQDFYHDLPNDAGDIK